MRIRSVAPLAVIALAGALIVVPSLAQAARIGAGESQISARGTSTTATSQPLEMADARRLARKVAREFARSDDRVTTAAVEGCRRRSAQHVDCVAVDRGESNTTQTVCRLRVSVRAKNGSPSARIASSACRTTSLLALSEADALAAMTGTLSEVTGRPVLIPAISRKSQSSFTGIGEWTRTGPTGGMQKCTAILTATRVSLNLVSVSIDLPACNPPQSVNQPPKGGGPVY